MEWWIEDDTGRLNLEMVALNFQSRVTFLNNQDEFGTLNEWIFLLPEYINTFFCSDYEMRNPNCFHEKLQVQRWGSLRRTRRSPTKRTSKKWKKYTETERNPLMSVEKCILTSILRFSSSISEHCLLMPKFYCLQNLSNCYIEVFEAQWVFMYCWK